MSWIPVEIRSLQGHVAETGLWPVPVLLKLLSGASLLHMFPEDAVESVCSDESPSGDAVEEEVGTGGPQLGIEGAPSVAITGKADPVAVASACVAVFTVGALFFAPSGCTVVNDVPPPLTAAWMCSQVVSQVVFQVVSQGCPKRVLWRGVWLWWTSGRRSSVVP